MTPSTTTSTSRLGRFAKFLLYSKKIAATCFVVGEGFYLVYRYRLYKDPNNPDNTRFVQLYCRKLCKVFNIELRVHGTIPRQPALWISNHVSWLDVPVLGSGARVFFLAKAEIEQWPLLGKIAKGGGTLFIKRGSGDSVRIREQITSFLKQDIPVLFFPEATTTDGQYIKRIHGRILGAAIEAKRPVQICLICYVNQHGQLDSVAPFIGNISFTEHVKRVWEMPKVTAHLMILPEVQTEGFDVDRLTHKIQHEMEQGLKELHAKVLIPS